MKKITATILLLIIFLVTFVFRTYFAFQTPEFSYNSYFSLRQIEHIEETGFPLFHDYLSFGGRTFLFPPLFLYVLSFFSLIFNASFIAKVIPNLLASLIIFPIYLSAQHITKKRIISLMGAFFSAFIPVFFSNTINNISAYTLVIPLIFFIIYFLIRSDEAIYLNLALFFLVVLVLTHSSSFFLVLGLLLFLLLMKVEYLHVEKKELEIVLFSTFLILWFNFVIYKQAFFMHGPLVIWQNIPIEILKNFFFDLNMLQVLYVIGIIPLLLGVFAVHNVFFKSKKRSVFLLLGFGLATFLLLWLKLVPFRVGLIFLSLVLVLLATYGTKLIYSYIKKTKKPKYANFFLVGLFILFILTSFIPALNSASKEVQITPSNEEIAALNWIKLNTPVDSVILGTLEEGHLINYFAERKNVLDSNFLLIPDAQQRYEDVNLLYKVRFKTEAVRTLNKYDVNYIYFSSKFNKEEKLYYVDEDCFTKVYDNSIKIYEVLCEIK